MEEEKAKEMVFSTATQQGNEFYRLLVTVSSAFLGGSLFFLEKITGQGPPHYAWILGLGWLFLIAGIVFVAMVRFWNVEISRYFLEEKYERAASLERVSRILSYLTIAGFGAGLLLLTIFGFCNLFVKGN